MSIHAALRDEYTRKAKAAEIVQYILDLSFEGVEVGGEFLLNLAADDVEHRQKAAGGLARLAGAGLRLFQGR